MNFESLNIYLKCIEAIMLNDSGKLKLLFGDFDAKSIDTRLTDKYLPQQENKGDFVDFNSVSISSSTYHESKHIIQVDILLALNEPVYLYRTNSQKSQYLIIKFYNKNIKQSVLYSYENLQLIESVLRLWLQINNNFETENLAPAINYALISKNQLNKINKLNDELNENISIIQKLLTSICSYLISEINTENLDISLSDSTVEFLSKSKMEIPVLKTMLQQAFIVARSLSPNEKKIRIKRYFINDNEISLNNETDIKVENNKNNIATLINEELKEFKEDKPKESKSNPKTLSLLDRYESVADELQKKNLPILGKNIAAFCNPPISPPALTDSINKHAERIRQCLKNYPEKWKLIRNNYKPVKNLATD